MSGGTVARWPEGTKVCQCTGATRGQLSEIVVNGAKSVEAIGMACGAGTVCGSCKPLLSELLGAPAKVEKTDSTRWLVGLMLMAAIVCLFFVTLPPLPYASSVEDLIVLGKPVGIHWDMLWRSGLLKQITGFSVLGAIVLALFISIRKRTRKFNTLGKFDSWRIAHLVFSIAALIALFLHSGLRLGSGLNFALMTNFLALSVLGILTTLVISSGHRVSPAVSAYVSKALAELAYLSALANTPLAWLTHLQGLLVLMPLLKRQHGSVGLLWITWIVSSCAGCAVFAYIMVKAQDKTLFMPGPLTDGHHQLSESCDSCHTDSFGGGAVLQESCIDCHGDVRKKPFDSHPRAKFTDPRNADMLSVVNATECVTCHVEHKPELASTNGLTQPEDVCFHCHESIAEERPSHTDMGFDTCTTSGCHNFHDNRALYTEFLVKRIDDPANLLQALVPDRDYSVMLDMLLEYPRDQYPVVKLDIQESDEPENVSAEESIYTQWAASGHAEQGVNCTACHVSDTPHPDNTSLALSDELYWNDAADMSGCNQCHNVEVQQFGQGKHGMRLAQGLTPMTPEKARLPMHAESAHTELSCNSCHEAHDFNVVTAAVESCLGCHADEHTESYKKSRHYALWLAEIQGSAPSGSGVSCATCHMPRVSMDVDDYNSRVVVDHNQSANLAPNSKMLRSACLECHGLAFSIDALADEELIDRNFQGLPAVNVESMSMACELHEAHLQRKQDTQ